MPGRPLLRRLLLLGVAAGFALPAAAALFPPVTEAERTLTSVAGHANAPAVVLFQKGEFWLLESAPGREQATSRLVVHRRVKVLTEAGKEAGTYQLSHSGRYRLIRLAGRTVLPDGRVVALPGDAVFQTTRSRSARIFVTSVAFPAVEPGAILDLEYEIGWEGFFFLDPWYFQDRVPVRHSEVVYNIGGSLRAAVWRRDPMHVGIHDEQVQSVRHAQLRAFADDLPPVPIEPEGPPFADMAAQQMIVPTSISGYTEYQRLFESWDSTCRLLDEVYGKVRRRDGGVKDPARTLAAGAAAAGGGVRAKAAAIHAFVRDEIATDDRAGVGISEDASVSRVFTDRHGSPAEKALLLQAMLAAVGIEASPVWAADRAGGAIDLKIANPDWFDRVLVAATVDGRRVFLDPVDRALAFGDLAPGYEGTPAIVVDRRKPETLTLPEAPFEANLRRATVDLVVGDDGRASGRGTLLLTGRPAWEKTRWQPDPARAAEAWKTRLEQDLPGFTVGGIAVKESLAEPRVEVSWTMAQASGVAGDELTLVPSRPLGPRGQPFPREARRQTPIVFPFASRDEVDLSVEWPAGWRAEVLPRPRRFAGPAGAVTAEAASDPAARRLTYRRRFDLAHRQAATRQQVEAVQALFDEVQRSDAEPLVLAKR